MTKNTEGCWMAFVRDYKALHPGAIIDYKTLLMKYIRGEKL